MHPKKSFIKSLARFTASVLYVFCAALSVSLDAFADDTDVFFPQATSSPTVSRNILIVLDNTSNWSRASQQWPGGEQQGQSEVAAISAAVSGLDSRTRIGVMEFVTAGAAGDTGGYVRFAMKPMTDTNKTALKSVLTTIYNNVTSPAEKRNSNTNYGDLMGDVYSYFSGGPTHSPNAVDSTQADSAGYTTNYTRFKSPLGTASSDCTPTAIIFVGNPDQSGPSTDPSSNTTYLSASGGDTTPLVLPTFAAQQVAVGSPLGLTSHCYTSLAQCSTADFATQCGTGTSCTCDSTANTSTTTLPGCTSGLRYSVLGTSSTTSSTTTTSTSSAVGESACYATSTACGSAGDHGGLTCPSNTTSTSGNTTTTTTYSCSYSCGAATSTSCPSATTTTGPTTSTSTLTACSFNKGSSPSAITPATDANTPACPVNTDTGAGSNPRTVTTYSCAAPTVGSPSCSGSGGNQHWPISTVATASKTVTTTTAATDKHFQVSQSTIQTITATTTTTTTNNLGNTFACYLSLGSCSTSDYSSTCSGLNGGCACGSPTTATGSCPSGQRFQVLSTTTSTAITSPGSPPTFTPTSTDGNPYNLDEWSRILYRVGAGGHKVTTYTIDVFNAQQSNVQTALMLSAASAGGGKYFSATNKTEIVNNLTEIFDQVLAIDTTFVSPAVTVNTYNRLTDRNELYFALFKPDVGIIWPGNLKRYQLLQLSGDASPQLYDAQTKRAIDASGFFSADSCSYWTATANCPDGPHVDLGGAASVLSTTRNVYTNVAGSNLTSATNRVSESNAVSAAGHAGSAAITNSMLGILSASFDPTDLMKWARGIDVNNIGGAGTSAARKQLGDPLHSEPTLIQYGGTATVPDITVFFGDNQGYLHAVNTGTGAEVFSFVPKELLPNLNSYYVGSGDHADRPFGMDGPITTFAKYASSAPDAAPSTAMVYAGMRRGGKNYYALDVTNRSTPQFAFQISGGTTGSGGDFLQLGQSWSRAVVANVRVGTASFSTSSGTPALIFSGGYDDAQDTKTTLGANYDSVGRGVFVVNATTGALLWSATGSGANSAAHLTISGMNWSIPASPVAVDLDNDGFIDRIYLADAGGQVIRIVLGKDASGNSNLANATGSVIAQLSGSVVSDARRFFNSPDIAVISQGNTSQPFISISVGSGHRENPLDTSVQDQFFVLKDPDFSNNAFKTGYFPILTTDLYDATANSAGSTDAATASAAQQAIKAAKGLFISMGPGEKVLTESSTLNNRVLFASYQPLIDPNASSCQISTGVSRFYEMSIFDATPVENFDALTPGLTASDRSKVLPVAGLPPDPMILFPDIRTQTNDNGTITNTPCAGEAGNCTGQLVAPLVCVGAVCFPTSVRKPKKLHWRSVQQ